MIKINSGWIVDGLIIARPDYPVLYGGSTGGGAKTITLEQDEVLLRIVETIFNS